MSKTTDTEYEQNVAAARALGTEHGKNAAAWWEQDAVGGRATGDTKETARRVLQGIDDGDPEIMDGMPWCDLSGQWADGMTDRDVLQAIDVDDETIALEETDDYITEYQDAFNQAVIDEIARLCREHLA